MATDRRSSIGSSSDEPPNSRLFIIGSKLLNENDYRNAFEQFGHIEEIWMVKNRQTGENKGVTYVKYSKTSEAARAMETMNGKCIGNLNRSIRVMIAASREQGSKRETNEEEKTQRLFVLVPKTMTDTDLYNIFKIYGDIDYASIVRDKETRESKGFAYVKYYKFSHAAAAFEQCDRKYKPVFAEPRRTRHETINNNNYPQTNDQYTIRQYTNDNPSNNNQHENPVNYTRLIALVSPQINQDQLWKLFDIVPGLDYCQLRYEGRQRPARGVATIVYTSPQWAAYAKDKLHGFEYPPGNRIIVKPDVDGMRLFENDGNTANNRSQTDSKSTDILQIAETIAQASNLIQAAGLSPDILQTKLGLTIGNASGNINGDLLCSVELPEPQPLASIDEETVARCFIVCTPSPPSNTVLRDVFCRFGGLIDVYMLSNRNCGYAKYTNKESAENAIKILHGAEICGVRIKVLEAEERPDHTRKRQRVDERY